MFFGNSRAARSARRAFELARIEGITAENRQRLDELEAPRNRPCPACDAAARRQRRYAQQRPATPSGVAG